MIVFVLKNTEFQNSEAILNFNIASEFRVLAIIVYTIQN
jgi:hypothetical protein